MNISETENFLLDAHLLANLGPRQALPIIWLIILTLVYIIILVSGLIGNFVTILVICRFRYMQTITNLYLCNLAITDLISLMFSLPLELYILWHQYPWQLGNVMCSLKTLILEGTANASVLTLVAFTVERFLAICGSSGSIPPSTQNLFNAKSVSRTKRIACRNIALIWTISLCGATPLVLLTRVNYLEYDSKPLKASAWCGLAYNEPDKRWELWMLSSTVFFFLIPLLIISFLYYQIARKLKQATKLDGFNQSSDMHLTDHATSRKIIQSRRIVVRMLVVIVIVFTFCWSPFHAQRLLFLYVTLYSDWNNVTRQINAILFLSAGCLYYLNSSLNPLIYSLLSTRFRAAFMLYVNGCCHPGLKENHGAATGSGNQRSRKQNHPQRSLSNNSMILVNGQQLKNHHNQNDQHKKHHQCLLHTPTGMVTKIQWNNRSKVPSSLTNDSQDQSPSSTGGRSPTTTTGNNNHHRHYGQHLKPCQCSYNNCCSDGCVRSPSMRLMQNSW